MPRVRVRAAGKRWTIRVNTQKVARELSRRLKNLHTATAIRAALAAARAGEREGRQKRQHLRLQRARAAVRTVTTVARAAPGLLAPARKIWAAIVRNHEGFDAHVRDRLLSVAVCHLQVRRAARKGDVVLLLSSGSRASRLRPPCYEAAVRWAVAH